jgi:hypothetical protein
MWTVKLLGTLSSELGTSAKKRERYQMDFLIFGFTYQLDNEGKHLHCVVCCELLTNSTFSARDLHRHLTIKPESFENNPLITVFERKLIEICNALNHCQKTTRNSCWP